MEVASGPLFVLSDGKNVVIFIRNIGIPVFLVLVVKLCSKGFVKRRFLSFHKVGRKLFHFMVKFFNDCGLGG